MKLKSKISKQPTPTTEYQHKIENILFTTGKYKNLKKYNLKKIYLIEKFKNCTTTLRKFYFC